MRIDKLQFCMVVSGITLLGASAPALAYLDPGSGSALLQGILAAFAAIAVTLKLYWHRLLRVLGFKKKARTEYDLDNYTEAEQSAGSSEQTEDHPR